LIPLYWESRESGESVEVFCSRKTLGTAGSLSV
jgi:hypothetical protein